MSPQHSQDRAHSSQHRVEPYRTPRRQNESAQTSIKDRLGEIVQTPSPYQNILPTRSTYQEDILDIHFNPDYEVNFMDYHTPPQSPLIKRSGENKSEIIN